MKTKTKYRLLIAILYIIYSSNTYGCTVEIDRQRKLILELKYLFSFQTKYSQVIEKFGEPISETINEIQNQHKHEQIDQFVQMHYSSIDFYFYFIMGDRNNQLLIKVIISSDTGIRILDELLKETYSNLQSKYGSIPINKDNVCSIYSSDLGYQISFILDSMKVKQIVLECGLD
jgi:hypothetical protein